MKSRHFGSSAENRPFGAQKQRFCESEEPLYYGRNSAFVIKAGPDFLARLTPMATLMAILERPNGRFIKAGPQFYQG